MLTKHIFVHTIIIDRERPYRRTSAMGVHYKENPNLIKCEGSTIKKSQLKIDSCTEVQESFFVGGSMKKRYQIYKLSKKFYSKYDKKNYPEIERKNDRPYVVILVKIKDNIFAIPFRTNIKHDACYRFMNSGRKTKHKTGLDFSKAVVINDKKYIGGRAFIDHKEFLELENRYYFIISRFKKYLSNYYRYVNGELKDRDAQKYKYTTLKYFHKELGLNSK